MEPISKDCYENGEDNTGKISSIIVGAWLNVKWWVLIVVMVKIMVFNPMRSERQLDDDYVELNHTDLICKL